MFNTLKRKTRENEELGLSFALTWVDVANMSPSMNGKQVADMIVGTMIRTFIEEKLGFYRRVVILEVTMRCLGELTGMPKETLENFKEYVVTTAGTRYKEASK